MIAALNSIHQLITVFTGQDRLIFIWAKDQIPYYTTIQDDLDPDQAIEAGEIYQSGRTAQHGTL
jgi:hypothetical protein